MAGLRVYEISWVHLACTAEAVDEKHSS
jgi:hypothetical protein